MSVELNITIPADYHGAALSDVLRRHLECSGTLIKQVKYGGLWLGEVPAILSSRVQAGDILRVCLPEDPPSDIVPVVRPLGILFEDEHLLILNKPPFVSVHPGPDHYEDTLGNFVTAYYAAKGEHHLFRPVNRLDRGTSGVMVVAKHSYAQERLKKQLHSAAFRREYLAICEGVPKPKRGTVNAPIGRLDGSVIARTVRPDGAQALTHYEVLSEHRGRSLVRLTLETGRTHQIRVHMAHIGCPLTGDFLYGTEATEVIGRAALHSAELTLNHPVTGEQLNISAPMPEDMKKLL